MSQHSSKWRVFNVQRQGNKEHATQVSAGVLMVLTASCKVFSFGSGEKGQLGNGRTSERITTGSKAAYDIKPYPTVDIEGYVHSTPHSTFQCFSILLRPRPKFSPSLPLLCDLFLSAFYFLW
ncbi:hypothetical protein BDN72DRAFT_848324 [Pluteus cervinus]|uniref:Uncharacterized protein n=1 Tax=Pluteus cervinus TaxID=181527 RepID=A0ACD3AD71_9AGAR|nr:hypothetical protein BDN72DRAFT_848324 [Pluteus cervinus]